MTQRRRVRVAIVGAGASGLVTARMFLKEGGLVATDVVVFDDTDRVGGLWNCQSRPAERDVPAGIDLETSSQPVYEWLCTNLPHTMMAFSDFPFEPDVDFFPGHSEIQRYLHRYAEAQGLNQCLLLKHTVQECRKIDGLWRVRAGTSGPGELELDADLLVVCNGHFRKAFVPNVPGLQSYKGRVMHSSAFRTLEEFDGHKVLVVGGGVSGADIVKALIRRGRCQVSVSVRTMSRRYKMVLKNSIKRGAVLRGGIVRFEPTGVVFTDPPAVAEPTVVLFATGYRYSFPFLHADDSDAPWVSRDGFKMQNLYNRVVYTRDPTLAFIGIANLQFAPFLISEFQAHFAARLLTNKVPLPSEEEMLAEVSSRAGDATQDALGLGCPRYCNTLAKASGFQGYWSQMLQQRLAWTLKKLALRHRRKLLAVSIATVALLLATGRPGRAVLPRVSSA